LRQAPHGGYNIVKPEGKAPFRRQMHRWEGNTIMHLKETERMWTRL